MARTTSSFVTHIQTIWRGSTIVERLIYIVALSSLAVWLLSVLLDTLGWLDRPLIYQLATYPSGYQLSRQPWGLLTYMWLHRDVPHLAMNLLMLYFVGGFFVHRYGESRLVWLLILGALSGALAYNLGYQLLQVLGVYLPGLPMLGLSAGIYALAWGLVGEQPTLRVQMWLLGQVRLLWLLVALISLELLWRGNNVGGLLAHLGGATLGLVWGYRLSVGQDLTRPFARRWQRITQSLRNIKATIDTSEQDRQTDGGIDDILHKIKHSGYTSLTMEERQRLYDHSQRLKR